MLPPPLPLDADPGGEPGVRGVEYHSSQGAYKLKLNTRVK